MSKACNETIIFMKAIILILVFLILSMRSCYYGHPFSSCTYTEQELELSPAISQSKILFTKQVELIRGDQEYKCLDIMGQVQNQIAQLEFDGKYYKKSYPDTTVTQISPKSMIELLPVKLIAVTKRGIGVAFSDSGPIHHLILKNKAGELFEVATVSLGINKGDEFLKAVNGRSEFLLTPDTKFEKY